MEARKRKDGNEHIALTVEILWKIWKARNDKEFKDPGRHPMMVIQKALRECEEYRFALGQSHQMSMQETSESKDLFQSSYVDPETITFHLQAGPHVEGQNMGIGVLATSRMNQIQAAWALRDRSTGSELLDCAQAIKLTLCKAKARGWNSIRIVSPSKKLFSMIKAPTCNDIRLFAHLQDISNLRSMFRVCSFDYPSFDLTSVTHSLCNYAKDIVQDEEVLDPQCLGALCV